MKSGGSPNKRKTAIRISAREIPRFPKGSDGILTKNDFSRCLTCGACASGCPVSGKYDMDPRKFVRMTVLGLTDDPLLAKWIAVCTLCGECLRGCPMGIDIPSLVKAVRKIHNIEGLENSAGSTE